MSEAEHLRPFITGDRASPLAKYRRMVLGDGGWLALARYELTTSLEVCLPGALGRAFRRLFFPGLFARCGGNASFGARMIIRRPRDMELGEGVSFGDQVLLTVKGGEGARVVVGDRVSLGAGASLSCRGGLLRVGDGTTVGKGSRLGSLVGLEVGREVTIGDGCYFAGGGHSVSRTDIPVILQPLESRGPIRVGDGAVVGDGVIVLAGVTIGPGAVVLPGSVVQRDVPAGARASGIPAEVL